MIPNRILYITKGIIPIFSTKPRKSFIVKKANIIEVRNPDIKITKSNDIATLFKSVSNKIIAPRMVGIPNKNANLDASFKFSPINNAAVIAVPDLDAPGMRAKHCIIPMNKAAYAVSS